MYFVQRDDSMHALIPRLQDYEDVEILFVARPMIGEEGMGAAAVGPGHRATTYTGVRSPEQPKGKGRRRKRNRNRGQELLAMRRSGYTASDAPGVSPQIRDSTSLIDWS